MAKISAAARAILDEISPQFQLSDGQLIEITNSMVGEFNAGLREAGRSVAMVPTFLTHVPDGTETGTFLTIGLMWTILRVSEVTLDGANKSIQRHKMFEMPDEVLSGTSTVFFDYIATSVDSSLKEFQIQPTAPMPIGLAFPFPVERMDLNKAKLVAWGKGLKLQDGPGQNVEKLLQAAFDRKRLNLKCGAIVNDTVTVLLSESYGYPLENCHISAIFGAGTNGAYVEDAEKIIKLGNHGGQMIVNTELGAYSNKNVLPLTQFDHNIDKDSSRPGFYLFEKLVSWVFVGEIVRQILVSIEQKAPHAFAKGFATTRLETPGSFNSRCLPLINEAKTPGDIKQVIADYQVPLEITKDEDAETVRWVSQLVSSRTIKLCASAVGALIIQAGYRDGTDRIPVALDGEMVYYYPQFKDDLRKALKAILGGHVEKRITFLIVDDAEAIGAALGVYEMGKRG
jgi:hexokinase